MAPVALTGDIEWLGDRDSLIIMIARAMAILSFTGWLFQAQAVEVAATVKVTPGVAQVLKLVQSGVADDVVVSYVENSTLPKPTADDVIQLHGAGVSDRVLLALLSKKPAATVPANNASEPAKGVESPAPAPPQTTVYVQRSPEVYVQPAPAVTYAPTYYSYPYSYNYGSYGYPYYGYYRWPSVSLAFGFGHGFGHHFPSQHFGGHGGHHGGLHFRRF